MGLGVQTGPALMHFLRRSFIFFPLVSEKKIPLGLTHCSNPASLGAREVAQSPLPCPPPPSLQPKGKLAGRPHTSSKTTACPQPGAAGCPHAPWLMQGLFCRSHSQRSHSLPNVLLGHFKGFHEPHSQKSCSKVLA